MITSDIFNFIKDGMMSGVSKLMTAEVVELAEKKLKELGKNAYIAAKLQAVISAKKHGITKVADVFNISRATLIAWIKHVKNNQAENLMVRPGRGRKRRLSPEQRERIKKWVTQESQMTIDQLKMRIHQEMGIVLGRSTAHRLLQKLDFAYITPRPRHYKQHTESHDIFKKKSRNKNIS